MSIKDGATIFIKNKKLGKFLFFLRDNKPTIVNPNMWGLLGGKIEDGEQPIEAIQRELKEESDVVIYNLQELGNKIVTHIKENQVTSGKLFVFLAETDAAPGQAKLFDEGQRLEYYTFDEMRNKSTIAPALREIMDEFAEKLR